MTTTLRLIRDVVTRGWLAFAFGAALVFLLTLLPESALSHAAMAAYSMLVSAYIALGAPLFLLNQREIVQLPVPRLGLWRSRTTIAVAFPVVVGFPATLAAIALRPHSRWPTPADAALLTIVEIAFCLSLLGLAAAWPVDIVPYDPKQRRLGLGGMAAFVLLFLSPMLFRTLLPLSWNAITPASAILMGVFAILGTNALVYRPAATPRASPPHLPSGIKKKPLSTWWPGDTLTGLRRLFFVHARQVAILTPCTFATIWFIAASTEGIKPGSARDVLHALRLMPFDVNYAGAGRQGFNIVLFVFVGMGDKPRQLMQRVRALRVMPMSAHQLSLMFAGLAVSEAAVMWLWLLGLHMAIAGALPGTLRMDIFAILCGALTLTRAIESLFLSSFGGRMIGMILFMTPVFILTMMFESAQTVMLVGGIASLAGGVALQTQILRRRQKLYKFKPPTFLGKPLPS